MTLRPANLRVIFVLDKDLKYAETYSLKNEGDSSLFQFGFLGAAIYKNKEPMMSWFFINFNSN